MTEMRNTSLERAVFDFNDPSLKAGPGGLTVWDLKKMVEEKRFNELENLFNNGLNMNSLPIGYAAGAALALLGRESKLITEWLDILVEKNWRGKVFFSSNDKRVSQGRNRIKSSLVTSGAPIVPMVRFTTMLLDGHPLTPQAKSNLVILSYTDPLTKPYLMEHVISKVQCYDVMVAVKGKYGPVFVGKTWLGKYDRNGEFTASNPDKLAAWYFLDFNEGALKEQRESHWDGSEEDILDPIPHIDINRSEKAA